MISRPLAAGGFLQALRVLAAGEVLDIELTPRQRSARVVKRVGIAHAQVQSGIGHELHQSARPDRRGRLKLEAALDPRESQHQRTVYPVAAIGTDSSLVL